MNYNLGGNGMLSMMINYKCIKSRIVILYSNQGKVYFVNFQQIGLTSYTIFDGSGYWRKIKKQNKIYFNFHNIKIKWKIQVNIRLHKNSLTDSMYFYNIGNRIE